MKEILKAHYKKIIGVFLVLIIWTGIIIPVAFFIAAELKVASYKITIASETQHATLTDLSYSGTFTSRDADVFNNDQSYNADITFENVTVIINGDININGTLTYINSILLINGKLKAEKINTTSGSITVGVQGELISGEINGEPNYQLGIENFGNITVGSMNSSHLLYCYNKSITKFDYASGIGFFNLYGNSKLIIGNSNYSNATLDLYTKKAFIQTDIDTVRQHETINVPLMYSFYGQGYFQLYEIFIPLVCIIGVFLFTVIISLFIKNHQENYDNVFLVKPLHFVLVNILRFFADLISFGILSPYVHEYYNRWKWSKIVLNKRRFAFVGKGDGIFYKNLKLLVLSVVTAGTYSFWRNAFYLHWEANWLEMDSQLGKCEYTGSGKRLFKNQLKVALVSIALGIVIGLLLSLVSAVSYISTVVSIIIFIGTMSLYLLCITELLKLQINLNIYNSWESIKISNIQLETKYKLNNWSALGIFILTVITLGAFAWIYQYQYQKAIINLT